MTRGRRPKKGRRCEPGCKVTARMSGPRPGSGRLTGFFPGLPKQKARSAPRAADKTLKLPGKGPLGVLVLLPILWLAGPLPWPALESWPDYRTHAADRLGQGDPDRR